MYAKCTSGPHGWTIAARGISYHAQSPFRYCERFVDKSRACPTSYNENILSAGNAYGEAMGPSARDRKSTDGGFKKAPESLFAGESEICGAPCCLPRTGCRGGPTR